jgi:transcriptional regulator
MFIPKTFDMSDLSQLHNFMHEFSFGVMVCGSLEGTHLPFVLQPQEGEKGSLYAHLAKANTHWESLEGKQVLVIFNGPHSYISPSWYAKGPAVPTWNYAAVHAYGVVKLLDNNQTLDVLDKTILKYEPELLTEREQVTPEYTQKLVKAIVGFKIELTQLQGKLKLGQNRTIEDQQGVYSALSESNLLDEKALANFMLDSNLGVGD